MANATTRDKNSFPSARTGIELAELFDILLPGSPSGWPPASSVLTDLASALSGLTTDQQAYVQSWAANLADHPQENRLSFVQACQEKEPQLFEQLLKQLYWAYYSSPAVQQALYQVADESPREESPYVDPQLVASVVAQRRGKRRL